MDLPGCDISEGEDGLKLGLYSIASRWEGSKERRLLSVSKIAVKYLER